MQPHGMSQTNNNKNNLLEASQQYYMPLIQSERNKDHLRKFLAWLTLGKLHQPILQASLHKGHLCFSEFFIYAIKICTVSGVLKLK